MSHTHRQLDGLDRNLALVLVSAPLLAAAVAIDGDSFREAILPWAGLAGLAGYLLSGRRLAVALLVLWAGALSPSVYAAGPASADLAWVAAPVLLSTALLARALRELRVLSKGEPAGRR